MIRGLSSSIYLLHVPFCSSDNPALRMLAFVNNGGSYNYFSMMLTNSRNKSMTILEYKGLSWKLLTQKNNNAAQLNVKT